MNDEIMQMLALVIRGNEGSGQTGESNRILHGLSQIRDPAAGAKCSHLWQPWNIRRTIAGFHCKPHFTNPPIPGYCFFTARAAALLHFSNTPPSKPLCLLLTLNARQCWSRCTVLGNHPLAPSSLQQSGPIQTWLAALSCNPSCAAFSCNLCLGHPTPSW